MRTTVPSIVGLLGGLNEFSDCLPWRSAWLVAADVAELPLLPHFLRQVDWVPLALGETP